jgi:hypothetical protein
LPYLVRKQPAELEGPLEQRLDSGDNGFVAATARTSERRPSKARDGPFRKTEPARARK